MLRKLERLLRMPERTRMPERMLRTPERRLRMPERIRKSERMPMI
jgi:hypothetical protein